MSNPSKNEMLEYSDKLKLYQILADSSFEPILIIENGEIIGFNTHAINILGYTSEELKGLSIFDPIHPDFHSIVKHNIEIGYESPYRIILSRKDGSTFPCEVQGRLIKTKNRLIRITALRDLSEKELAQEKYMRLVENSPQITYVFSKKHGASFWSARIKDILGFTPDDLLKDGFLWMNSIVEEDRPRINEIFFKSDVKEGTVFTYQIKDKSGNLHWFRDTIFSVNKKDDDVIYEGICEDITERKNREDEILESESKMRFLASTAMEMAELKTLDKIYNYVGYKLYEFTERNTFVIISEYDLNGKQYELKSAIGIGQFADKITKLLGFNLVGMKGEVRETYNVNYNSGKLFKLGNSISDLTNHKIPKRVSKIISSLISLKDIQSISIQNASGIFGNIAIARTKKCKELDAQLIEAFISQVSVFIHRLNTDDALQESQLRLNNMIGNIKGVVYRCLNDEEWTMKYLNKEIEFLSGYKVEELTDNKVIAYADIVHPEDRDRVEEKVKKGLKRNKHFVLEYRIITKSGDIKWVWEKGIGILNSEGELLYLEGIISDITEIKENEKKIKDQLKQIKSINIDLEHAKESAEESDRLKSAFLANMSHEIRTPMNSIIGFSEIMGMKELPEQKKKKYLQNITNSGKQLLRLIDDIIDISKIESNQIKLEYNNCNIDESLIELIETIENTIIKKSEKKIEINFIPCNNLKHPIIRTDEVRFRQIVNNLLSNAAKYTEEGKIEVGYALRNTDSAEYLEFYIKDTGIGISKSDQEKLFSRFYQAKSNGAIEGTGLGLSISKALVELIGGKIWLESDSEGSIFYFNLPYLPVVGNMGNDDQIKEGAIMEFKEKQIYIAEDDLSSYILLEEYLEETGIGLSHAENGKLLMTMIEEKAPDLVLLDINMPVMNGFETIKEIRRTNKDLLVIAQTAYAMQNEKNTIIAAGCNDYISKPIDRKELMTLLRKYI